MKTFWIGKDGYDDIYDAASGNGGTEPKAGISGLRHWAVPKSNAEWPIVLKEPGE